MFARTVCSWFCVVLKARCDGFGVQHQLFGINKKAEFVYCAVRAESLNIKQVNLCLNKVKIFINISLPNRMYSSFLNHG
jgi:hypothetical protein